MRKPAKGKSHITDHKNKMENKENTGNQQTRVVVNPYAKPPQQNTHQNSTGFSFAPPSFIPQAAAIPVRPLNPVVRNFASTIVSEPNASLDVRAHSRASQGSDTSSTVDLTEDLEEEDESSVACFEKLQPAKTRKRHKKGILSARIDFPVWQVQEEVVELLADEVAKKIVKNKNLVREMAQEMLPLIAKGMQVTYAAPGQSRKRRAST